MGVWRGSPGRLGGSQPLARQPSIDSPSCTISTRTKTDGIGLFTGQIGYAWNQALFYVKGGAAVTSNRFSILENVFGLNWPRPARPAGVAPSVLDLSTASHRTGRSVLNTTTCSWAMPIIRSPVPLFPAAFRQQPDHPRRGYGHRAHQLPLRRLWCTDRSEILTSRYSYSPANWAGRNAGLFCWRPTYLKKVRLFALSPSSTSSRVAFYCTFPPRLSQRDVHNKRPPEGVQSLSSQAGIE